MLRYDERVGFLQLSFFVTNLQGDVIAVCDNTHVPRFFYHYDAWGKLLSVTNTNGDDVTNATNAASWNSLRYRGYVYDSETGLYYVSSRYYDPEIGRMISPDSAEILMASPSALTDKNLYAYCDNNPVVRADGGGEFWHIIAGAVVSAGLEVVGQLLSGNSISEINWNRGGVAAVSGAITSAVGPVAGCVVSGITEVVMDAIDGEIDDVADAAKSFAWGTTKAAVGYGASKLAGNIVEKLSPKIGVPFKPGVTGPQYGVDPKTLIPKKKFSTLDPYRMNNAIKFGGDHMVEVGIDVVILNGNHRVAYAIKAKKAVDVFVYAYRG